MRRDDERRQRETLTTAEENCWKEVARFRGLLLLLFDGSFLIFCFLFLLCFAACPFFFFCLKHTTGAALSLFACNNSHST
jgi:hypothetical protein